MKSVLMFSNVVLLLLMSSLCFPEDSAPLKITFSKEAFPLREKYPDVKIMEMDELRKCGTACVIVDVRSGSEFYVIHIASAINRFLGSERFAPAIARDVASNPGKKIVFYCNGHSCAKSYKAVSKAKNSMKGFNDFYAMDAGVFDWTIKYPDKAVLLGERPVPLEKIISKDELKSKMIDYKKLQTLARDSNTIVIDIRESFQREVILDIKGQKHMPFDALKTLLRGGIFKNRQIVFVDAVGKQVRWLQYLLKKYDYENYYFLEGGVAAVKN